jgi:hypothetical protein
MSTVRHFPGVGRVTGFRVSRSLRPSRPVVFPLRSAGLRAASALLAALCLLLAARLPAVEVGILRSTLAGSIAGGDADDDLAAHYNAQPGFRATLVSGTLDSATLAPYDLFVVMLPDDAFTAGETAALADFVSRGRHLLLIGEQHGFAAAENGHLNALLPALGSSMSLGTASLDTGLGNTTSGQIVAHPLNLNVATLNYGNINSLAGVPAGNRLFLAADLSSVWGGFEDIDFGRVVLLADANLLSDIESTGSNDNGVWFNNVAAAAARCAPFPSGAVSWWRAGNNANDSLGANQGTLANGAAFAPGRVGQAFSLDGVDDVVTVASPTGLPLGGAARTMELWFRTSRDLTTLTESGLLGYGTAADDQSFALVTSANAPGRLYFYGHNNDLAGTTVLLPDTWYHGAVTYDGVSLKLYLNGALEASKSTTALNTVLDGNGLRIGERSAGSRWEGWIDEPTIYARALSPAEIQAVFNAGSGGKCAPLTGVPADIVAAWPAEGNALDALGDHHGTLVGTATFAAGKVGQAFTFDSDDDGVTIAHSTSLDVGAGGFSVEFWMRGVKNQPGSQFLVVDKSHGFTDNAGWLFQGLSASGFLEMGIGNGSLFPAISSGIDVLDGTFHHVAGVWDGEAMRLHVDGVERSSTPFTGPVNNTRDVNLGFAWGGGTPQRFFRGQVDELAIYQRALLPAEVAAIYNAGANGKATPRGVTFVWNNTSGNWTDASRWVPEGVPGAHDTAVINAGTVTLDTAVTVANLTLNAGVLFGSQTIEVTGECHWLRGTMTGSGALNIPPGASLIASGADVKTMQSLWKVNLAGFGSWSGSGNLRGNSGATFVNTGVFEIRNDATLDFLNSGSRPVFDNQGTLRKTGAAGTTTIEFQLDSTGLVEVRSGEIDLVANGNFTGATITGAGKMLWNGSTYTLNGNLGGSSYDFVAGFIAGNGTILNTFTWLDGDLSGSAHSLTINPGAQLLIRGTAGRQITGGFTLNNLGTIRFEGSGPLVGGNSAVINNTGLFELLTGAFLDFNNSGTRTAINNSGTLRKSIDASTATIEFELNNNGLVDVQTGALELSGGGTSAGEFRCTAPGVLNFIAGTHELQNNATFTGSGFSRLAGANLQLDGTATVTGNFELSSEGVSLLLGTGTLMVHNHMTWSGGTMSGPGRTVVSPGANLVISGVAAKEIRSGWTLRNEGNVSWTESGDIDGNSTATIENAGTWSMQNDARFDFLNSGTRPVFQNTGTIVKDIAGNDTEIEFDFINNGTVDVRNGTVSLLHGATFDDGSSITGAGRLVMAAGNFSITGVLTGDSLQFTGGAMLGGGGTVNGTLHWTASTMRGGTLNIGAPGRLLLEGADAKALDLGFTLNNAGTIIWSGPGTLQINNGADILNSGLFDIQGDFTADYLNSGTRPAIHNTGTVRKSAGVGSAVLEFALNNTAPGRVESLSGSLDLRGGGQSNGRFSTMIGAVIEFTGQTQTLLAGASLDPGEHVVRSTGTLNVNGPVTAAGTLAVDVGGVLGGTDTLTVTGRLLWKGGTMTGSGTTRIDVPAQLEISSAATKTLDFNRTLINHGSATWNGDGDITGNNGADIENHGTWEMQNDRTFRFLNSGTRSAFINTGTLRKAIASVTSTMQFTLVNSGTVDIQSGTLDLAVSATLNDGSTFTGGGRTRLAGAGQTWTVAGSIGGSALELADGSLAGSATITGTLTWSQGAMSGAGTLVIAPLGALQLTTAGTKLLDLGYTLDNRGTARLAGDADLRVNNGADILNSGLFDLQTDRGFDFLNSGTLSVFSNTGTFRKSGGAGPSLIDLTFNNSGTVQAQAGQLNFVRAFTQTAGATTLAGGGITTSQAMQFQGGTLGGAGTITGGVNNTGATVGPGASPGVLTIGGDYTQGAGGTLHLEIGGTTPGVQHDRLIVTGTANLAGTLRLSRINGFAADPLQEFQVLDFAARSGTFAAVEGTVAGNGNLVFAADYRTAALFITVQGGEGVFDTALLGHGDGLFSFRLYGAEGQQYVIEASSDLANWSVLTTQTVVEGRIDFVDEGATVPHRFYRARLVVD